MKKTIYYWVPIICILISGLTSCEEEQNLSQTETNMTDIIGMSGKNNRQLVTNKSIINKVQSLDIDTGLITKGPFELPDGSFEERIYIGEDITITSEELEALYNSSLGKQYRTFNLVSGANQTINILGYTANNINGLSSKAQTALQWAVDNYNNLNTSLQFNLTYGTNWQAADMVVYDTSSSTNNNGGSAGFPSSSGQPYKFVQIYNIEQYSTNVNEHVIVHEIGHSLGFRHSDWFDRLSCPPEIQGTEQEGSEGIIHISGTPTGRDLTSVMQACFSINEDGEFNANDIIALEAMYPVTSSICSGVAEWQSGVSYPVGARVTYFGNLYERTSTTWIFIGPC